MDHTPGNKRLSVALILAPTLAVVVAVAMDFSDQGLVAALFVFAAVMWISEAIHPAQTALLVIALAPAIGACSAKEAFGALGSPILFLFVGSFMIAEAMRRHGLGRRLAHRLTSRVNSRLGALVATSGAAFLLSMWISNTASTAIVLPIALAICDGCRRSDDDGDGDGNDTAAISLAGFKAAMVLAVAWAASMGGLCTPVGTPPNLLAVRAMAERGTPIDFLSFMKVGLPIGLAMWACMLVVLAFRFRVTRSPLGAPEHDPARWARGEVAALVAFLAAVVGWTLPSALLLLDVDGAESIKAHLPEEVVALFAAAVLFVWPVHKAGETPRRALSWDDAVRIDWGTVFLFGGGILLGNLANKTGLATRLGETLIAWSGASSAIAVVALVVLVAIALSEVASNTASATLVIPIALGLSQSTALSPMTAALGASLAASFGFMMPISTAPNAMAYGTGAVSIRQMVTTGIVFDVVGAVVVVVGVLLLT